MTSEQWGRVEEDGTVYVKTADGERSVGQYPEGTPEEALAFFTNRFDQLAFEVEQLERRVHGGKTSPDEATVAVKTVVEKVSGANAVGDLASLVARLDALAPVIATQREARKAERAAKAAEAKVAKEALVEEAEKLAQSNDWRNGANRLRELLDQWKALPRIDRGSDDALWRRFSTARTAYTRRRKAHFAELNARREDAKVIKERIIEEAEQLSTSTDWGPTAGRYRDLMRDWKAAGPAPKDVDDKFWKQFRAAQDVFFGARDAANAAMDAEFAENAVVKEGLLVEAQELLPLLEKGDDLDGVKRSFRSLADRWDEAGKVPRDRIKELEGAMRKVEQAIKSAEDDQWRKSDPEKSARADDMISKLEDAIAQVEKDLDKARSAGDDRKIKSLEENLDSRRQFLDMAKRASDDFS
ncbi:MAG: DUF349 domain-containing protein [Nocardioides sp.]|uniref:DUF349 domain-containing protein n=1 Tax=Nocardioides sp. TaxID=35761 RepID=UPI003D6B6A30